MTFSVRAAAVAVLMFHLLDPAGARAQQGDAGPSPSEQRLNEAWWDRYAEARALLLQERYAEAGALFEALASIASTTDQKRVAFELAMIARALQDQHEALRPDAIRTSDELSLLYSSAFVYGFGTSAWLSLQIRPEHFAGAVLPFAALTSAAVGGVAVADGYRPFARGVPHGISAGLYLGFLEGVWVIGFQHARATRRDAGHWDSARVSTVLWSGATAGAVLGGVVASSVEPEPGNVSFVSSSALWGGIVAGLAGAALQPEIDHRGETGFVTAAAGYNLGLGAGLLAVPSKPLSVARIRVTDVSGLGGALLAAGTYVALAGEGANPRITLGAAGVGASAGLGLGWWLTEGMVAPIPERRPLGNLAVAPLLLPVPGGASVVLSGAM